MAACSTPISTGPRRRGRRSACCAIASIRRCWRRRSAAARRRPRRPARGRGAAALPQPAPPGDLRRARRPRIPRRRDARLLRLLGPRPGAGGRAGAAAGRDLARRLRRGLPGRAGGDGLAAVLDAGCDAPAAAAGRPLRALRAPRRAARPRARRRAADAAALRLARHRGLHRRAAGTRAALPLRDARRAGVHVPPADAAPGGGDDLGRRFRRDADDADPRCAGRRGDRALLRLPVERAGSRQRDAHAERRGAGAAGGLCGGPAVRPVRRAAAARVFGGGEPGRG